MKRSLSIRLLFSAAVGLLIAPTAFGTDAVASGKVAAIFSVALPGGAPGNADERVYLVGSPALCTGATDPTWAYINVSDPNFKGVVSSLLFAYATNKTILVAAAPASVGNEIYCQISWMMISG